MEHGQKINSYNLSHIEYPIGGQVYYLKKFTHYTVDQAEAILAGLVDVDEDRQAQDRSQRQIRDRYLRA